MRWMHAGEKCTEVTSSERAARAVVAIRGHLRGSMHAAVPECSTSLLVASPTTAVAGGRYRRLPPYRMAQGGTGFSGTYRRLPVLTGRR